MPHKDPEAKRRYHKQYNIDNREKRRAYDQRYRTVYEYGVTKEQYDEMLIAQSGRCALCWTPLEGKISIDHNHETEKVRGIIHQRCNLGLAYVENGEFLKMALAYLETYDG